VGEEPSVSQITQSKNLGWGYRTTSPKGG